MATTYKNYDQAKAAYDALVTAKDRALRNNEIQRAQTLKGIDRRILQNGITGGHQETTELLARSAANANAANIGLQYDPEIASLYAQLQALRSSGSSGRGKAKSTPTWGPGIDREQWAGAFASMPSGIYDSIAELPKFGPYKLSTKGGQTVHDSRVN